MGANRLTTRCKPEPSDSGLYAKVKKSVREGVKRWPSAYASALVVQRYKAAGGEYESTCPRQEGGLTKWFSEKWVDVCQPALPVCGRNTKGTTTEAEYRKKYPKCRPLSVAKSMSLKDKANACAKKRRVVAKEGTKVVWVR